MTETLSITHLGQPGQAANIRASTHDDMWLAPDFDGSVRLGIERLQLTGRPIHEKENARLRLAKTGESGAGTGLLVSRRCLDLRHGRAHQAERAHLKQLAPRQPVAEAFWSTQDAQHQLPFRISDADRR